MKPERAPAHAAPVTTQHTTHAAPSAAPVSEFAALLSGAVGGVALQPAEPSPFEALLGGSIATHAGVDPRKVVLICGCGNPRCPSAGQDGYGFREIEV